MDQVDNAGQTARPGTPQAAGVSFAEMAAWANHRAALARLAGQGHINTRFERKPGESVDDHALRVQIDMSPRQWV
ncbi:MAG: hypothetical protein V4614_15075 [Pseudomonadota bacterium]